MDVSRQNSQPPASSACAIYRWIGDISADISGSRRTNKQPEPLKVLDREIANRDEWLDRAKIRPNVQHFPISKRQNPQKTGGSAVISGGLQRYLEKWWCFEAGANPSPGGFPQLEKQGIQIAASGNELYIIAGICMGAGSPSVADAEFGAAGMQSTMGRS